MNRESVEKIMRTLIGEQFEKDPLAIKLHHRFKEDFDADSLDTVELIMACESKFGILIPEEVARLISTPQEAIDLILKMIS